MSDLKVSDSSVISIPLRNLIAIIIGVSVAVSGYFALTQRLDMIEKDTDIMKVFVDQNSEFRVKWPRGELGALPDDAEQNMRLNHIEKQLEKLLEELDQ
jgi:tetrahydromethanopterin S-methyltransferase subunit G|tara:strand:- start:358 stop:654 length:297 start_codon:yes stop_codon:yes gene_type:complete